MKKDTVKLSLHLSSETNKVLESLAQESHITKSELLRKAVALIDVAMRNKKSGKHLFIVNEAGEKESEIIGL